MLNTYILNIKGQVYLVEDSSAYNAARTLSRKLNQTVSVFDLNEAVILSKPRKARYMHSVKITESKHMCAIRLSDGRYYHKSGSHKKNPWTATLFQTPSGAITHMIKKRQKAVNFDLKSKDLFKEYRIVHIRMSVEE